MNDSPITIKYLRSLVAAAGINHALLLQVANSQYLLAELLVQHLSPALPEPARREFVERLRRQGENLKTIASSASRQSAIDLEDMENS